MLVNGEATPLTIARENNSYRISGAEISILIQVQRVNGDVVPLDSQGYINGQSTDKILLELSGAKPGEEMTLWMFSTPIQIGRELVGDYGKVSGTFDVPDGLESGPHRIVVNAVSYTGTESTVSIGFLLDGASNGSSPISIIIYTTLGVAVAFALVIPATRRRRRRLESA